jgi:hypothetical protein
MRYSTAFNYYLVFKREFLKMSCLKYPPTSKNSLKFTIFFSFCKLIVSSQRVRNHGVIVYKLTTFIPSS